jgi:hypothetical protein
MLILKYVKKSVILFFLVLYGLSGAFAQTQLKPIPVDTLHDEDNHYFLWAATEQDFNVGQDIYAGQDTSLVNAVEKENEIRLRLTSGKEVIFQDDTVEGDDMVSYSYEAYYPDLKVWYIHADYWEDSADMLIDCQTGEETGLLGEPVISPNKKYIATYSGDLVTGFLPNGLQVLEVYKREIEPIFEIHIDKWEPSGIRWLNGSELIIKRAFLDENYNRRYDYVKLKLK